MEFDYVELSDRIWKFNENRPLGLSTLSVYFFLLKVASKSEFTKFTISDSKMSRALNMTRKTVKVCKDKLQNFGIISYQSRNGIPSHFELISDYPLEVEDPAADKFKIFQKEIKRSEKIDLVAKDNIEVISVPNSIGDKPQVPEIPKFEEFIFYVKSIENYDNNLQSAIANKYQEWVDNQWKNNFNRPITNWKSAIKNALPYLKNIDSENNISFQQIPSIKRVKIKNKN